MTDDHPSKGGTSKIRGPPSWLLVGLLVALVAVAAYRSGFFEGGNWLGRDEASGPCGSFYVPEPQELRGTIDTSQDPARHSVDQMTLLAYGGAPRSGYRWTVPSGSTLPAGTAVDPDTGVFYGTGGPIQTGTHRFSMTVSDGSRTATGRFTFVVMAGDYMPVATFQLAGGSVQLPDGCAGLAYGASLLARGGTHPLTWEIASGTLPPGLSLSRSQGVVHGTIESYAAGNSYTFSILVRDARGDTAITANGQPGFYVIAVPG